MKKQITIIADVDCPTLHLLNQEDWDVYQAKGDAEIFTMVKKEKRSGKDAGKILCRCGSTETTHADVDCPSK